MVEWPGDAVVEDLFSTTLDRAGTASDVLARQIGHRLQVRWAESMAMDLILAEEDAKASVDAKVCPTRACFLLLLATLCGWVEWVGLPTRCFFIFPPRFLPALLACSTG